jgi:hypothetical protein
VPNSLLLVEVCPNPAKDINLDGSINSDDRYVRIVNTNASGLSPNGLRLAFADSLPAGDICAIVDPVLTYPLPSYSYLYPDRPKTIYGSDLRNLSWQEFEMPTTGAVALCNNLAGADQATTLDRYDYIDLGPNWCYVRLGDTWTLMQR